LQSGQPSLGSLSALLFQSNARPEAALLKRGPQRYLRGRPHDVQVARYDAALCVCVRACMCVSERATYVCVYVVCVCVLGVCVLVCVYMYECVYVYVVFQRPGK